MKCKKIPYYLAIIIIATIMCDETDAQEVIDYPQSKELVEKTYVITDRETYCADEPILFSAFNISEGVLERTDWSHVLYLELISPNGEVIVHNKYSYENGANGKLIIPKWVLSGNYYLRAYTRWMRDFSPETNFYKMVRVINPFRAELLEASSGKVFEEKDVVIPLSNSEDFSLKCNKKIFSRRKTVNLSLTVDDIDEFSNNVVVSVIRKGTETMLKPQFSNSMSFDFIPNFIPETRGVSVSGKVVNEVDSVPLPYALVGLTIIKKNPENLNLLTDRNGRFYFDLSNLRGEHEIFISAKPGKPNEQPLILVDNDFSTSQRNLPFVKMDFSKENRKLFEIMSFTSQIEALYREQKSASNIVRDFSNDSIFYGQPDFSLNFDEYIDLPSVKDYLHELVPRVRTKWKNHKEVLQVVGLDSELDIYDPLVLVDMVSIFDVEKVLALNPEKLKSIEVIINPYIRGDITYGGIISFFSKEGDLAGIDLPSAGRFISYKMLSDNLVKEKTKLPPSHIAELGNCLYWNSSLKMDPSGTTLISFNTGDNNGDYLIVVRGLNRKGELKVSTSEITIQ